jgi:regulator of sigma E protease
MDILKTLLSSTQTILWVFFWLVVILIPLVIIHELGHYLMARLMKVRVVEFGVGVPPRSPFWKFKNGVVWSLNWIPLGGFAKIYGDHDALDNAQDKIESKPDETRKQYSEERFFEVLRGKELQFVLQENGIPYDAKWKNFEKNWNTTKGLSEEESGELDKKANQLKTLIDWELDAKLKSKSAFYNTGAIKKIIILLGGIIFNFIGAWVLIFGLLNTSGIQANYTKTLDDHLDKSSYTVTTRKLESDLVVAKGGAAELASLRNGDKITKVDKREFKDFASLQDFIDYIQTFEGKPIKIEYITTSNEVKEVVVTPVYNNETKRWLLGVVLNEKIVYKAKDFWSSFGGANKEVSYLSSQIGDGIKRLFSALAPNATDRSALNEVSGPVLVGGIGSKVFELSGIAGIIYLMAIISIGLAITNLIPIPALDGGRILIVLINKLLGKRNKAVEGTIISITYLALLALMMWVLVKDISVVREFLKK